MYNLLVRGSDRDGATDGLSSECDCRIKILDVNDNFPILEKTSVSHYFNDLFPLTVVCLMFIKKPGSYNIERPRFITQTLAFLLYGSIPTCLSFSFYLLIVCVCVCVMCQHTGAMAHM